MCTCISFGKENHYFGRNLDLETPFGEQILLTPRQYPLEVANQPTLSTHYAMIGMASAAGPYPFYAEAANEKGLCMAGLSFPQNAYYVSPGEGKGRGIASYALIAFVLGQCATLSEAKALLETIFITNQSYAPDLPAAPLHWMIADQTGALVLEQQVDGLHLYENPTGVLTNNPPFPFQMEHLRQYLHLTPKTVENTFAKTLSLTPFGQGFGAIGLPGDWSPASRFVKTVFLLQNSLWGQTEAEIVTQAFHVLDQVSMVRGSVLTAEGKADQTLYSCLFNATKGIYYYTTYENRQISTISLWDGALDSQELQWVSLQRTPQFFSQSFSYPSAMVEG